MSPTDARIRNRDGGGAELNLGALMRCVGERLKPYPNGDRHMAEGFGPKPPALGVGYMTYRGFYSRHDAILAGRPKLR